VRILTAARGAMSADRNRAYAATELTLESMILSVLTLTFAANTRGLPQLSMSALLPELPETLPQFAASASRLGRDAGSLNEQFLPKLLAGPLGASFHSVRQRRESIRVDWKLRVDTLVN
jgi:hypothetical protein